MTNREIINDYIKRHGRDNHDDIDIRDLESLMDLARAEVKTTHISIETLVGNMRFPGGQVSDGNEIKEAVTSKLVEAVRSTTIIPPPAPPAARIIKEGDQPPKPKG